MPGVTHNSNVLTSPVWAADYLSRDHLVTGPMVWAADYLSRDHLVTGPIELDKDAFLAEDGARVVVGSGGAAIGATSIPVGALTDSIPSGTFLNFGTYGQITVTVNDADVNATETEITVVALPGPVPAGTILQFSGAGAGFAKVTADAAAGATSLTVEALPEDIDNGATATFEGGTKQARLTSAAAAGDTTLTVDDLQFAVAEDDVATYAGAGIKKKRVVAGTYVGRTFAQRESNLPFGPIDEDDDERFLVAFDVIDLDVDASATAVRHGTAVKENRLPEYSTMSAAIKALLRADYTTQKGAD